MWRRPLAVLALPVLVACGDEPKAVIGAAPAPAASLRVDRVVPLVGVPDRARDPAVVVVARAGGEPLCSGALVAADLVLTARRCVAPCGEPRESAVAVFTGEDADHLEPRARGRAVVTADEACAVDAAFVVLDRAIPGIEPLPLRTSGVARGDRVRTVGYGAPADKRVREHAQVVASGPLEFHVAEASCRGEAGGPAIDESSGHVVGVLSRPGPSCLGADSSNAYVRADLLVPALRDARARASSPAPPARDPLDAGVLDAADSGRGTRDASVKAPAEPKPKKPPTDLGGGCERGADCAAGACVVQPSRQYCTRTCEASDRCPTPYECARAHGGESFCLRR